MGEVAHKIRTMANEDNLVLYTMHQMLAAEISHVKQQVLRFASHFKYGFEISAVLSCCLLPLQMRYMALVYKDRMLSLRRGQLKIASYHGILSTSEYVALQSIHFVIAT